MSKTSVLITGGTGSLGSALVEKWYHRYRITVLSRDPHKQAAMTNKYPDIHYILADICNEKEARLACEGQDILIHAAALKDVGTGEYHPNEFVRVNVSGSQNIAAAWHETHKNSLGKALLISTDKACASINLYGKTKAIAESIFRKYDFSVVRYGNVVGSNGSFLPIWKEAKSANKSIKVRTPDPTRFFLRMDNAIALIEDVLTILETRKNGIFVPHSLHSFSILDIAQATGCAIEYEALLPYEKQHEVLVVEGENIEKETELLSRIVPGISQSFRLFKSDAAQRLSGQDVLRLVGW